MSQLSDYRAAVRLLGYDSVTDALVDLAINEGRRRVCTDHRWSFLQLTSAAISLVANQATVQITPTLTGVGYIEALRLTYGGTPSNLDWKPLQELRDLQTDFPDEVSTPLYWTRRNNTLLFFPTPDAAYTANLQYVQEAGTLSGSTTDVIPTSHKDLVVWASVPPLAFRQRDFNASAAADNYYRNTLLPRLVTQDITEQRQTSRQVR